MLAVRKTLLCLLFQFFLLTHVEAATLEGIVVANQEPLEGAVVKAYLSLQDYLQNSNPLISSSGPKPGFFTLDLPAGTYYLTASGRKGTTQYNAFHGANPVKLDNTSIWMLFTATPYSIPVQKPAETSKIIGKVHYKGKPVKGAQVSLYSTETLSFRGLGVVTKNSDNSGEFSLSPPPGTYVLIARKRMDGSGEMPLVKGDLYCFYGANPLNVEYGRELQVEVACHPKDDLQASLAANGSMKRSRAEAARFRERKPEKSKKAIIGRVTDRAGNPATNLQVTAYRRDSSKTFQMHHLRLASENMARTDANGNYFLPLKESGSYYLLAREYSGESPLKGELYGLFEANHNHAVTVDHESVVADLTVSRVMAESPQADPPVQNRTDRKYVVTPPSVITHDTVWSGEVLIDGPLVVARSATLKITPGTTVRFVRLDRDDDGIGDGELRVLGRIIAKGTPDQPIRFMSAEKSPRPGDWSYLLLFTSGEENVIEHSIIEHAFSGIQVHFSRALIRDSIFSTNKEGIRFGRAELEILQNEIRNNEIGIRYHRLEGPVEIRSNIITENNVGLFLVPSGQNTVDYSDSAYSPDVRYYKPPYVTDNNIMGNYDYNFKLGDRLVTDIGLEGNWWGSTNVTRIISTIFDRKQNSELGKVDIFPPLLYPVKDAGPRNGDIHPKQRSAY